MESGLIEATLVAFGALSEQAQGEVVVIVGMLLVYAAYTTKIKHKAEKELADALSSMVSILDRMDRKLDSIDERTSENATRLIRIEDRSRPGNHPPPPPPPQ